MAEEKASAYRRAPETRGAVAPYEEKFAGLIRLCESARTDGIRNIVVTWPWIIGDNYEELMESLSRIADAGLVLHIVKGAGKSDSPNVTLN